MSLQEEYEFILEREFLVFVEGDLWRDFRVREMHWFYFNSGGVYF